MSGGHLDLDDAIRAVLESEWLRDADTRVIQVADPPPIDLPEKAAGALRNPLRSPRLRELAKDRRTAVIITSDQTRGVPNAVLLPLVLGELDAAGIARADVTVVVATGVHRPLERHELRRLLGESILDAVPVVNHEAMADDLVDLGAMSSGNRVLVNRIVASADLKIALGVVEPHEFAGFTGGRKSIHPGVTAYASILNNHALARLRHPSARPGVLEGNPVHEEMLEAARSVGLDFIVNVTLDSELRATRVSAGDPVAAHQDLVHFLWETMRVPIGDEPCDLLVTGPGRPLDVNLYQSVKALVATECMVGPDSAALLISECAEGHGSSDMLQPFAETDSARDALELLEREYTIQKDHSYYIARFLMKCGTVACCCPGVADSTLRQLGFVPAGSVDEGLAEACRSVSRGPLRVAVVPRPQRLLFEQRRLDPVWGEESS